MNKIVRYQHKCILTIFYKIGYMEKSFFSSKEAAILTECTLRQLQYWRENKEKVPEYANPDIKVRLMLIWDSGSGILDLIEFEREQAIAFLDNGQPIIPLWLDLLHQKLQQQLIEKDSIMSNK